MVRDVGALPRPPGRTSGAGVGGAENAARGAASSSRPPLRAIQPPASGAPRRPVPTAMKDWEVRASKIAVRSSLAPRKPGAKLPLKSELTTVGTSSVEEPRYKIRDAISFWEENHSNGKNASSALQLYGSLAPAKIEYSADEKLMIYSEDILKLQLELDILKTILVEEITSHAEVEKATGFDDELKAPNLHIHEASRQKEASYEKPKMQSFKFFDTEDAPLSANPKRDQASHVKGCNLNTRCRLDEAFCNTTEHNSLLQSELTRRDELSKVLPFDLQGPACAVKDKADELIKVTKLMASLEKELASKYLELDDASSDRQQLEAQILKTGEKAAALEEELAKKLDELNIVSMENAELKSQLNRIERISCTMGELAHTSKVIGRHEEDLIELRSFLDERNINSESWRNDLSKLLDEKKHSDTQVLVLKEKLEVAQTLTDKFEAIATEAQQRAMLLERSVEDLEITICELENKVDIIKEEAKNQRVQREELELELQNVRLQTVTSRRSIRYPQDIQNELLSADENTGAITKEVCKKGSEVLGPVQEGTTSSTIRCKHNMGMMPPFEELLRGSCASDVEPCADACSSSGISEDDADISLPNMHDLPHNANQRISNTYPVVEAVDSDQSQSKSEEQVPAPTVEPVVEVVEESELPPVAPMLSNDPVGCSGVGMDSDQSQFESTSEELVAPPAIEIVVRVVEENELPPVAQVRTDDPVNYMRAPSDELKRLRSRNHYEGQRTATDRRFWSIEQQDLYNSIYSKAKVVDKKWTDWKHVDSVEQFAGVRSRCAHLGLEQIMGYSCDWDNELIKQFYSTVYISADKTTVTWMADGRWITTNKRAWQERFSVPGGIQTDIHSQLFLNDDDKRTLYTSAECTLGHINGLLPLASIANKILRTTIYPRFGNTTHSWNVLYHIVEQHQFDIIALIFGEMDLLISDHSRTKDPLLYAPYIMGMITGAFEYRGPRESRHHSYKPRPYYKSKVSKKVHPPEVAATGHEAHVEAVDDHNQFEATGHQSQVEVIQGRAVLVQPITRTGIFQVVEDGLRPTGDTLASMERRIGRVEDRVSVRSQHINSRSSSQIPTPNSVAPSLQATTTAPPEAPVTSLPSSGQPRAEHADTPTVSAQPFHVRPSPFSGFRWYQKK